MDGVDVILFGLYVYEHDETNAPPNHRAVYISYLDSVHYMRPRKMRTFVYHELLASYLDYVRIKGYLNAHIWACPPLKGDDYILFAKPEDQKTPKDDRLRQWYIDMLKECQLRGIVGKMTNAYDFYFADGKNDATVLPYMEGDYFPAEMENIIKDMEEGKNLSKKPDKAGKKGKNDQKKKSKAGARGGTRSSGLDQDALNASGIVPEGVDVKSLKEGGRDWVMRKLGETIHPMKESFLVAFLNSEGQKPENLEVPQEVTEYREKHEINTKMICSVPIKQEVNEEGDTTVDAAAEEAIKEDDEDGTAQSNLTQDSFPPKEETYPPREESANESTPLTKEKNDTADGRVESDMEVKADSEANAEVVDEGEATAEAKAEQVEMQENVMADVEGNAEVAMDVDGEEVKESTAEGQVKEESVDDDDYNEANGSVGKGPDGVEVVSSDGLSSSQEVATELTVKEEKKEEEDTGIAIDVSADENRIGGLATPDARGGKFAAMAKRKMDMETPPKPDAAKSDMATEEPQSKSVTKDSKGFLVKVIDDDEEEMDCEFLNNRQSFLNLCQGNHYQFDSLRRAKHTSMMVLWHLHNRDAPKFVQQCAVCAREILQGKRYHCPTCADFDQCIDCIRNPAIPRHQHPLQAIPVGNQQSTLTAEQRKERQRSIGLHMTLLLHASTCRSAQCTSANCAKMKGLLKHGAGCKIKANGGCNVCKRIWALLQIHARQCKTVNCLVPNCLAIRERFRQLQLQQQAMDDRRRQMMNQTYHQQARQP